MRVVAIVQARTGSSRLPGKVLLPIEGETMLARVVKRSRAIAGVDEVCVATTDLPEDDGIEKHCRHLGATVFRGPDEDVLQRFAGAASAMQAQAIIRITSDCPLLDPGVAARVVRTFLQESPDYASNTLKRTYPRGLDTEVFSRAALNVAVQRANKKSERVHVTPFFYNNPQMFRLRSVEGREDYSRLRWTVDTQADLRLIRKLLAALPGDQYTWRNVLELLDHHPDWSQINAHVEQKAIEEG